MSTIYISISTQEFAHIQADLEEIRQLLLSPADSKFIELAIKIVSLQNRLEQLTTINE
jgi:hypothetical protein